MLFGSGSGRGGGVIGPWVVTPSWCAATSRITLTASSIWRIRAWFHSRYARAFSGVGFSMKSRTGFGGRYTRNCPSGPRTGSAHIDPSTGGGLADGGGETAFGADSILSGASFIYGWACAGGAVFEHGPKKTISGHEKNPPRSAASTPGLPPPTSRTRPRVIATCFMGTVLLGVQPAAVTECRQARVESSGPAQVDRDRVARDCWPRFQRAPVDPGARDTKYRVPVLGDGR